MKTIALNLASLLLAPIAYGNGGRLPQSVPDLRAGSFQWAISISSDDSRFQFMAKSLGFLSMLVPEEHLHNANIGVRCHLKTTHGSRLYGNLPVPFEQSVIQCDLGDGKTLTRPGPTCAADNSEDSTDLSFSRGRHQLEIAISCSRN